MSLDGTGFGGTDLDRADPDRSPSPHYEGTVRRLRTAGCVFAEDEARLLIEAADTPAALDALVWRRVEGEPLEYIVGWVEFCGLRIAVDPGVFVPRQRTELLVQEAVARAAPGATVVDLACGCGALGLAVAHLLGAVTLYAVDIEPGAVACAARNLTPIGGYAYLGDLFAPLPVELRGHVDLLVANVPYVPSHAVGLMPPEARLHEPLVALDGGGDGLDVFRRVAAGAVEWLAPGGHVLMETGDDQVGTALGVLATAGLISSVTTDEETGATVLIGTAPVGLA